MCCSVRSCQRPEHPQSPYQHPGANNTGLNKRRENTVEKALQLGTWNEETQLDWGKLCTALHSPRHWTPNDHLPPFAVSSMHSSCPVGALLTGHLTSHLAPTKYGASESARESGGGPAQPPSVAPVGSSKVGMLQTAAASSRAKQMTKAQLGQVRSLWVCVKKMLAGSDLQSLMRDGK